MTGNFFLRGRGLVLGGLLAGIAGLAGASEFEGHWGLKDTSGKPFEITLGADGSAVGTHNDSMKHGKWAEEGGAAVIHWDTGWTTRIAHDGKGFRKTAFKPGKDLSGPPANSSDAIRLP